MKQQTKTKIEKCKTLNEFLDILLSEYDCENCKPGKFAKDILIRTIISNVSSTNIIINESVKQRALLANNIAELIKVIKSTFNVNAEISPGAKKNLINSTVALCKVVNLKEK